MRPIVLQEIRQFDVVKQQPDGAAWAHQHWGNKRLGAAQAFLETQLHAQRRVKHPPVQFEKGVSVDRFA